MPARTAHLGIAAATLCLTIDALAATVIYVDSQAVPGGDGSSWNAAFADLQDALAHAANLNDPAPGGDIQIWIAAGTYAPETADAGPESTFNLVSGVALYGGFAGGEESLDERDWEKYEAILSGFLDDSISQSVYAYSVLIGENLAEGSRLDGLTIRDGHAWEWGYADAGGGLLLLNSTLHIANCTFTNNSADIGGAIYSANSSVTIENTKFISNDGWDAGGIRADGGTLRIIGSQFTDQFVYDIGGGIRASNATITVQDTTFHANTGGGISWAGAGSLENSNATFTNCTFTENSAYGPSTLWTSGSLTLDNCTFDSNGTGGYTVWGNGSLNIVDSVFTDNEATPITWSGGSNDAAIIRSTFAGNGCSGSECGVGGVQIVAASITIEDSTFHDNSSPWGGNLVIGATDATLRNCRITGGSTWYSEGGLSFSGGALTAVNTLIANNYGGVGLGHNVNAAFINCTIINNPGHAYDNLAGIWIPDTANVVIHNSILWGNAQGDEQAQISGPAEVFFSVVQMLDQHAGNNNIGDDPLLADADGRLSANSPAIDAGDNDAFPSHIEQVDLDGNPRIVDGAGDGVAVIDIGAFEFQPAPAIPGDLTDDGKVGVEDLLVLLAAWGNCANCNACPADLSGNCNVGVPDLLILLANWTG